jgi:cytoskeleton protein RodZ
MSASPIKLEPLTRPRRARKPQQAQKPLKPLKLLRRKTPQPQQRPSGLAARRELNGVSLNDIAERTRIPLRHLVELERGDLSQWPAGVYAKSWAREYAVEAGLDPDEVSALVAPVAQVEPSIEEIKHAREEGERLAAGDQHPLRAYASRIAAVAVVLVLLLLAGFLFARYEPERQLVPASQPVGTSGLSPVAPR